jgi:transcriptional regulator with XRE-family HTH domain
MSFGTIIAEARKKKGMSQKDLAAQIKKEDGQPISPQYLNDLERDRRNPPSSHFLKQFAEELGLSLDYLSYLARQLPDDVADDPHSSERVDAAFRAFRKELKQR